MHTKSNNQESVQRGVLKYTIETPKENSRKCPNNPQKSKKERAGIKYREETESKNLEWQVNPTKPVTLNVNGPNAFTKRQGFAKQFINKNDPTIYCIQEIHFN